MTDCSLAAGFSFQLGRALFGLSLVASLLVILGIYCVFAFLRLKWKEHHK